MAVSVGIVNHNGRPYLARALEAVGRLGGRVDEVLLIDNGSSDDGVAFVRERYPHVRVIELGENRGPGAARNVAIREAKHPRILLMDNDAEPQPGCVETLAAALDAHPGAVLAMPAVVYAEAPDTVQFVGAEAHFLGAPSLLHAESPLALLEDRVRVVGSAITCCLMIDRARFAGRRWFDEAMLIYLEDHEFGLRASLLGFDCLVVPGARCLHGAGTIGVSIRQTGRFTPVRVRHTIRNRWFTMLMLYQKRTFLRFAPALAAFEAFQLVGVVAKGWFRHWLWAVGSTARSLSHLRRNRRVHRRHRRRADMEVLVDGPFPYNKAMHRSMPERAARRALDAIVRLTWRLAGGTAT